MLINVVHSGSIMVLLKSCTVAQHFYSIRILQARSKLPKLFVLPYTCAMANAFGVLLCHQSNVCTSEECILLHIKLRYRQI